MEEFVEKSYLFDFYGELLTEHQRRIYTAVIFEDLSPSELAKEEGISRQGVHDMIRRCDKILADYEKRLHLVEKFLNIRKNIRTIQELTGEVSRNTEERMHEISRISSQILEEL